MGKFAYFARLPRAAVSPLQTAAAWVRFLNAEFAQDGFDMVRRFSG
jgi:hypothetical protein